MKSILCRLVQRAAEPPRDQGWRGRHYVACSACRTHFEQARAVERHLRTEVPPADEELCRDIMFAIQAEAAGSRRPASGSQKGIRPWWIAVGAAAAAALAIAVIQVTRPNDGGQAGPSEPESPPVEVIDPRPPNPAPAPPAPTLVQLIEQQELLQRDAQRLGAHLRERVILFQPLN